MRADRSDQNWPRSAGANGRARDTPAAARATCRATCWDKSHNAQPIRASPWRRILEETQADARLHHGNIVDVYDFSGGADDEAYLITEVVHGEVERDGQDCPAWCGVGGTGGPAPDYRPSTSENPSACRA